jgi:methionyl-tRNA synthetase
MITTMHASINALYASALASHIRHEFAECADESNENHKGDECDDACNEGAHENDEGNENCTQTHSTITAHMLCIM